MSIAELADNFDAIFGQHRGRMTADTVVFVFDGPSDHISHQRERARTQQVLRRLRAQYRAGDVQGVLDHLLEGHIILNRAGSTWQGYNAVKAMRMVVDGHFATLIGDHKGRYLNGLPEEVTINFPSVAPLLDTLHLRENERALGQLLTEARQQAIAEVWRKRLVPQLVAEQPVTVAELEPWARELWTERIVNAAGRGLFRGGPQLIQAVVADSRSDTTAAMVASQAEKLRRPGAERIARKVHEAVLARRGGGGAVIEQVDPSQVACHELLLELRRRGAVGLPR